MKSLEGMPDNHLQRRVRNVKAALCSMLANLPFHQHFGGNYLHSSVLTEGLCVAASFLCDR